MVTTRRGANEAMPDTGRAEISAAIEKLAGEVVRLTRYVHLMLENTASAGIERNAKSLKAPALNVDCENDARASALAEVMENESSLQPESRVDVADKMAVLAARVAAGAVAEDRNALKIETNLEPRVENAIAKSLADLSDRLGGFIKPSNRD
jgi:hypothetical protein